MNGTALPPRRLLSSCAGSGACANIVTRPECVKRSRRDSTDRVSLLQLDVQEAVRETLPARETIRVSGRWVLSAARSEEHTSELQSPDHLVCRLLLAKKKNIAPYII